MSVTGTSNTIAASDIQIICEAETSLSKMQRQNIESLRLLAAKLANLERNIPVLKAKLAEDKARRFKKNQEVIDTVTGAVACPVITVAGVVACPFITVVTCLLQR